MAKVLHAACVLQAIPARVPLLAVHGAGGGYTDYFSFAAPGTHDRALVVARYLSVMPRLEFPHSVFELPTRGKHVLAARYLPSIG